MNVLALDLGTTTGWAATGERFGAHYGELLLATPKQLKAQAAERGNRRADVRVETLFWWLKDIESKWQPKLVVFEDVQFRSSTYQTQLWSALRAAVWLAFSRSYLCPFIDCVNVKTLKKFSTGSGNADKAAMIAAARLTKTFQVLPKLTDNEADAILLHEWAVATHKL